ncbi:MAG: Atxe2 family lasso peptide isopeptidase [Rhizomicrobium sp.]
MTFFIRLGLSIVPALFACFCAPVPACAAAPAEISMADIINAKYVANLAISPDHRYLAFALYCPDTASNTASMQWWVLPLKAGAHAAKIADGGESFGPDGAHSEKPVWSALSDRIYYRKLDHGAVQIWAAAVDGSKSQQVTHDDADISSFSGTGTDRQFTLDDAHNRLFYKVGATRKQILDAEDAEDRDAVHIDPLMELYTPLVHNAWYNGRLATIRRDFSNLMYGLRSDVPLVLKVLDLRTGAVHLPNTQEAAVYARLTERETPFGKDSLQRMCYRPAKKVVCGGTTDSTPWAASADGKRLAILATTQHNPLVTVRNVQWLEAGDRSRVTACTDPRCTGTHLAALSWWDNDRQILFIGTDSDGFTDILSWNVASGQVRTLLHTTEAVSAPGVPGLAGASAYSGACPILGDEAFCTVSDANQPPQLIALNLRTGERKPLFDPNAVLRTKASAVHVEHMYWADRFGRRFHGVLALANGLHGQRVPLVITSYSCGGFLQGASGGEMPELVLADHGIAALCVRADGTVMNQPYPGGLSLSPVLSSLRTALDSWEAAVQNLTARGLIDPKRVGVSGHSFGAKFVWYAITHSKTFSAAISNSGYDDDPVSYYMGGPNTISRWYYDVGSKLPSPSNDPTHQWDRISAALNAAKITAPVLIQGSDAEFAEVPDLYVSMLDAKKPVDLYVFSGEGHQFRQPYHRLMRAQRNLDWFRFWFDHYKDPNMAKANQYRVWEHLCTVQNGENPNATLPCPEH